jgi:hypothetical protein
MDEKKCWWFTFGSNHFTPQGYPLDRVLVRVEADSYGEARDKLVEVRNDKWAFQYDDPEKAGKSQFGLIELGLDELKEIS